MKEQFIILEQFLHPVRCCCPGQIHEHMLEFYQGDSWFITKERKFIDCLGWYFLIDVNKEYRFYMHTKDIEYLYQKGSICPILDLELKINYLNLKVNEALDMQNRKAFFSYSDELNNAKKIKDLLDDKTG